MSVLLLTAAAVIAIGVVAATLGRRVISVTLQVSGCLLLAAAGVAILARGTSTGAAFASDWGPQLGVDPLSAFFLIVVAIPAALALLVAGDDLRDAPASRGVLALTGLFVLAMAGLLCARDSLTFLAAWELMTLVPATAILLARPERPVRRAVFVYLAITHVGGVGVWTAILTLAQEHALGDGQGALGPQALVLSAALIGFGTKAGVMPLHVWLPRAHPVAPPHISALMSGVMVKVALYGLIRVVFDWAAPAPAWVGIVLVGAGAFSAVGGILYAALQPELKRALAFSTVENVGVIVAALGASVLLADAGRPTWAALAFAAALLHVANHALFKSLLFLSAGAIAAEVGGLGLDRLGGLLRRMPWTAWALVAGCAAIAGIPPLNGFASEWLVLQGLLHVATDTTAGVSIAGALGLATLGAAAGLAVLAFVKLAGLVVLGPPRSAPAAAANERPLATRVALTTAAAGCLVMAATAGLVLPTLVELAPGPVTIGAGASLDLPGTGGLPVVALIVALALLVAVLLRLRRGAGAAAPAPVWTCGGRPEPALLWTSAGFTKPLRLVLDALLRPAREVELQEAVAGTVKVTHHTSVPHPIEQHVYVRANRAALRAAGQARRLQSGSLSAYALYLLMLLLAALAVVRIVGGA